MNLKLFSFFHEGSRWQAAFRMTPLLHVISIVILGSAPLVFLGSFISRFQVEHCGNIMPIRLRMSDNVPFLLKCNNSRSTAYDWIDYDLKKLDQN